MANPALIGLAIITIVSTVSTVYMLKKSNKSSDNTGEIINTVKVILPKDNEIAMLLYCIVALVGFFALFKIISCCAKTFKKSGNRNNALDLADLENPRYTG